MHALVFLRINQQTTFDLLSFTNSKDMIGAKFKKVKYAVFRRLALDIFYFHTKFGDSRFSRSGDMIAGIESENGSRDSDHAPFGGGFIVIRRLGFETICLCAKFDDSIFIPSIDIIWGPKI